MLCIYDVYEKIMRVYWKINRTLLAISRIVHTFVSLNVYAVEIKEISVVKMYTRKHTHKKKFLPTPVFEKCDALIVEQHCRSI